MRRRNDRRDAKKIQLHLQSAVIMQHRMFELWNYLLSFGKGLYGGPFAEGA